MQNVLVIGAGNGGQAVLEILCGMRSLRVRAVVDINPRAPGLAMARKYGIPVFDDWKKALKMPIDIIIDVTGSEKVYKELEPLRGKHMIVPGSTAQMIVNLMKEKEQLIDRLRMKTAKDDLIFDSIHDGMIIVDKTGRITMFNAAAEKITGIRKQEALNRPVEEVIPASKLPKTIRTKQKTLNEQLVFPSGKKVVTTRIPIIEETGTCLGAFSVFKDITELAELASEITNLKEIQTMLEAIIHSSNDAISVVDENGNGILINPAYTRLTGLTEKDVIGQPATIDISEGESMHLHVLKTKKPVRGVRMKVGPHRREVVVNVAPIIVDNQLRGSVGIIHDLSEIQSLTHELEMARERIRTLEAKYTFDDIIGQSEGMVVAKEQAKIGARTPATVLLRGESGTGKELFAHAIHNESNRRFNKFIRVNCAALPETLLESELFGYEEGAFSGAKKGGKKDYLRRPITGASFWMKSGNFPPAPRRNFSGCCRKRKSSKWAAPSQYPLMYGLSRQPIKIWKRKLKRGISGKICFTG